MKFLKVCTCTTVFGQFIVSSLFQCWSGSCFVSGIFCPVGRVRAQRCPQRCPVPGRRTWTMCLDYRDSPRSWAHFGYSTVSRVRLLLTEGWLSLLFLKCYMWSYREDCMVGKIILLMIGHIFKKVEYDLHLWYLLMNELKKLYNRLMEMLICRNHLQRNLKYV